MKQRKVLLISYHFPPMGGSGVQRAAKLAAHLPMAGWSVHVLCAGHRHYSLMDPSLGETMREESIHRIPGYEAGGIAARMARHSRFCAAHESRIAWRLEKVLTHFPIPEPQWLWTGPAFRAARDLILKQSVDAIITTSPPHSVHCIGRRLKKQLGVPWIADLRDPLIDNFGYAPRYRWQDHYWHTLEAQILDDADELVVTSGDFREKLIRRYPLHAPKINLVHNGFDPDDGRVTGRQMNEPAFVVSHVGSFYGRQSIGPALEAFRAVVDQTPDLRFRQVGSVSAEQRRLISPTDQAFLDDRGYVTHADAIIEMRRATALLLITPDHPGGRYCIPAKTFEYLAFGSHIIAVTHRGSELSRILRRAGNVTVIEDHSVTALQAAVQNCHSLWRQDNLQLPRDMEYVSTFRRDRQAQMFAVALHRCTADCYLKRIHSDSSPSLIPSIQGAA